MWVNLILYNKWAVTLNNFIIYSWNKRHNEYFYDFSHEFYPYDVGLIFYNNDLYNERSKFILEEVLDWKHIIDMI